MKNVKYLPAHGVLLFSLLFFLMHIHQICHFMACTDISAWTKNCLFIVSICLSHPLTPSFSFLANHRRAGHAVTNILAKELMQEDTPSSSKLPAKKKKTEETEEPKAEGAESLEELLDAAPSRSN